MKVIYDSYAGQVASIAYHHMGADSAYLFNPVEIDMRAGYYGVGGAPHYRFDGAYLGSPGEPYEEWYSFVRHAIDSLLQVPSPIGIDIDQYSDEDSVYVSFDITAFDSVPSDLHLYVAVVEYGHRYVYPHPLLPKLWFHILRDFVPDAGGQQISLAVDESLHFDRTYPIYDVFYQNHPNIECDSLDIITTVFVQDGGTQEVLQAQTLIDKAGVSPKRAAQPACVVRNVPNPFHSETTISFQLGRPGPVQLSVYTLTGELVTRIVAECAEPGEYSITWDGRNRLGRDVGSGIYYYRLESEGAPRTGKAILIR
jgi:hypothetical protein